MPITSETTLQNGKPGTPYNGKITVVTGEFSGEIHAFHLITALRGSLAATFSGIGGTKLREAGMTVVLDYGDISLTGFSEVFAKLRHIRKAFLTIKEHLSQSRPSLVILVDFPGFNLRVARTAKRLGIPVVYFIPPQIWAWRESRAHTIRRFVDKVICILPFEKALYEKYGIDAVYVGHPFMNTVKPLYSKTAFLERLGIGDKGPLVTIMPGSRENEITKHVSLLFRVVDILRKRFPDLKVLIPVADTIDSNLITRHIEGQARLFPLRGLAHDALAHSDLAIVASGSATLEAAILGTPTIVVYEVSTLSYALARMLVKVKHISLPNIIAGRGVFPEFIQDFNAEDVAEQAIDMLNKGRDYLEKDLEEIRMKLGVFDSYRLASEEIIRFLEQHYGPLPKTP